MIRETSTWQQVYLGVGSNLGSSLSHISAALAALNSHNCMRSVQLSPLYVSAAIGPEQPDYLNAVIGLQTCLSAIELLDILQQIENQEGRERKERWGPRTLDLDILLFGDTAIDLPRLQVPHPEMLKRNFVLRPLADLCPERVLAEQKTCAQWAEDLGWQGLKLQNSTAG